MRTVKLPSGLEVKFRIGPVAWEKITEAAAGSSATYPRVCICSACVEPQFGDKAAPGILAYDSLGDEDFIPLFKAIAEEYRRVSEAAGPLPDGPSG